MSGDEYACSIDSLNIIIINLDGIPSYGLLFP